MIDELIYCYFISNRGNLTNFADYIAIASWITALIAIIPWHLLIALLFAQYMAIDLSMDRTKSESDPLTV